MKLKLRHLFLAVLSLTALLAGQSGSFAQSARIVFNAPVGNPVYMRLSGGTLATPICLVVDNAADQGFSYCNGGTIACPGSNVPKFPASGDVYGWVVSEGQYNYVVWRSITNASTPTYLIPVGTTTATTKYMPVQFKNNAASTTTKIAVSTYTCGADNKFGATPSFPGISDGLTGMGTAQTASVTNMYSAAIGQDAANEAVIDRWWDIDADGSPNADVTFRYLGAENTLSVSVNTGPLSAQHWTGTNWNNGQGGGDGTRTATGANGGTTSTTVYSATAAGLTQFSPYVLVADAIPLPVTWLDVSASCNHGDITVKWSTASEQNSDYFTVERSYDGNNFTGLANVLAAGQSSTVKNYSFVDEDPIQGVSYYRIRETNFNSSSMISAQMTVNGCSEDDIFIFGSEGGISVNIDATTEGKYVFELYDLLGRNLMNESKTVPAGSNHLKLFVSDIASAMYVVKVYSGNNSVSKKVFIRSTYVQ